MEWKMSTNVDDVLVQANFKTPRGTLLNVYGKDEESFDMGIAILEDRIAKLIELEALLSGASNAAPLVNVNATGNPQAAAESWTAPSGPPAAMTQGTVPTCQHGQKNAKSGASAKGPWRAWMCSAPKGDPSQCQPDWVRRGTPEWDNFPA
jgi:hypothetical protein